MNRAIVLAAFAVACGGTSDPCEQAPATITWGDASGLVVTLHEPVAAGSALEIGQQINDATAVILDFVTVDGSDVFAETTDGRAEGFVVMRLPAPWALEAGAVITHKIERLDRAGLVEPSAAWFAVEVAQYGAR